MKSINKNVKNIVFGNYYSIFTDIKRLSDKYKDVEDLTNEFLNLQFPIDINNILKDYLKNEKYNSINNIKGFDELRKEISLYELKKNNIKINPYNEIVLTQKENTISFLIFYTLLNKDDEVIIGIPNLPIYKKQIIFCGGRVVEVKTKIENEFKLTADEIKKNITKKTKIVFLQTSNPMMSVYTYNELKEIAEVCKKNDLFVVSDERYDNLYYNDKYISIRNINGMDKRSIIIKSFISKIPLIDFNCGYIIAYKDIIDQLNKVIINVYKDIPIIQQSIILEFLKKNNYFDFVREKMKQKKDILISNLVKNEYFKLPYIPKSGNCLLLKYNNTNFKSFRNSYEIADYLLKSKKIHIGVVPSIYYGIDGYIVLYYSNIDVNKIPIICKRLYGIKNLD